MASKKFYIGSFGPFFFNDTDTYPTPVAAADQGYGDGKTHTALRTEGVVVSAGFALSDTDDSNVFTLVWNEDDNADRTFNLLVGGGDRSLTLNENLTIGNGYDVTITALGQANTLTLNESFTLGNGNSGTLTYSAASKTLTVEDDAVVSQDYSSDSTTVTLGKLTLSANGVIGVTDGDPQIVFDNANNWLEITGKVGIGTNSPDGTLHVHTATAGTYAPVAWADDLTIENSGAGGLNIATPDGNEGYIVFSSPIHTGDYDTYIGSHYNAGSEYLRFGIKGAGEIMRMTTLGNVGINVTDPDTKLEVLHAGNQLKLSFDGTDNCVFAVDTAGILTITPSGANIAVPTLIVGDHGTAATDMVVNVCYGTGVAPAANTTTIGALYITYVA